ncbi:formate-dependent phosphoribosylglycinamide formyltransferase [Demequina sp. SYSU T00039]|uniref:Formate-dependent phosphoribosylglycinamide formyltransferase n=1 Tax=Demequina lignilytica TaxID=3051663 RepID=A0AAW7M436_9MICO|nr:MULTISPECIES: formate-dependent phosphoribosylglycinamide formyltransferase [unclassified Demequina]MDN4478747.1 formate-dependent phosphoribosylglycinamide formyltransferase [Demequina sp. SYSU T00039-1]MDN4488724.1 formate-dependent phosphoribosylglycinamide formyltransferase [Demequina sp. SYSU T00039]
MTVSIGTPLTSTATRALLLGSGELGKEVAIELSRLGVEVVAVDRYADAPAMQVAHRAHVIDMLDPDALRGLIALERPQLIIPEIEAIATSVLAEVEAAGDATVIPTARATMLTMDREGIRRLAAEELGLPTSPFWFVDTLDGLRDAVSEVGLPCVVKPVMSSSGKGQSVIRSLEDVEKAWTYAAEGGRAGGTRVIVEGFVDFDYEITQLTVRHEGGTTFLAPIGHVQVDGDYRESWQPQPMSDAARGRAQEIAGAVTGALGGRGVFGVELFVRGDEVLFNEVSPRPHDTGLVTLAAYDRSEFALHARAVLGLPVEAAFLGPSASCAVLAEGSGVPVFSGVDDALAEPHTDVRLFGKPRVDGRRRVAVAVARAGSVDEARERARAAAGALRVDLV